MTVGTARSAPLPTLRWFRLRAVRRNSLASDDGGHGATRPLSTLRLRSSIDFPNSRCRQFQQMPVGIAEINAVAAARPVGAALDRDLARSEPCLPVRELAAAHTERHVQGAAAVVRRNGAARHHGRLAHWE